MSAAAPHTELPTHRVENVVPPIEPRNLLDDDPALREAMVREGASWALDAVRTLGGVLGAPRTRELGELANRHSPELQTHDRAGRRIDEVRYHPAYHELMQIGISHRMPSISWVEERPGGHVAHVAMTYLFSQVEAGTVCPMTMTYAVLPVVRRHADEIGHHWAAGVRSSTYDPRFVPVADKAGLTAGMAMTEKQGGSDVRANSTRAEPDTGLEYRLTGHKWFCSAPMSDFFLTLAQAPAGLTCFLVPRFTPDGERNRVFLQRLKDKLGNRSNASSEVEYDRTWALRVGEEGAGVRTIIEMVHHTRNDTVAAPAAYMRQALREAVHHTAHRSAFGRTLIDQPLMANVLADLAIEVEAAVALSLRVARSFDRADEDESERAFCRLGTSVAKYWLNKRAPVHVVEALECLGGGGYVEDSIMPRLYREAPLNGIWEGSGNVICLDVLRAIGREPGALAAVLAEIRAPGRDEPRLLEVADEVERAVREPGPVEPRARWITEKLALGLQGSLLVRHAPAPVADAFVQSRLGTAQRTFGALAPGTDLAAILARAGRPG